MSAAASSPQRLGGFGVWIALGLFVAALVGGSSWLVDRANPSLTELHDRLTQSPLSEDEVPPGMVFERWLKERDRQVAQEGHLYAAAYFKDQPTHDRVAFALYRSVAEAQEAFEGHEQNDRSSAESAAANPKVMGKRFATAFFPTVPDVDRPSFCRTQGTYAECVAFVGRVVVVGETRIAPAPPLRGIQDEPRGAAVEMAAALVRSGIKRAERLY